MQVQTPFEQAVIKKYPEQIVIALAREESGKVNPITLGWTMLTSHKPPMMAISVGVTRYSLEVIRKAGEFVISYPSVEQEKSVILFGTTTGRNTDKLTLSGEPVKKASAVNCLILENAVANFECRMTGELTTGDHVIIVGEVVASHINDNNASGRIYSVEKGYKMGGVSAKQK